VSIVAFFLFVPTLRFDFTTWDDGAYVLNNPNLRSLDGLRRIWLTGESEQYYPLTFTSYWIEYRLWGTSPRGYHATNAVLHALNAGLLLIVLHRIGMPLRAGLAAALLFAVHPVQVMTVAWVAERKNLLSCLFMLLTFAAWTRMRRRDSNVWYVAVLAAGIAAMLSKTGVLTLPLSLAALDRWVLGRPWRSSLLRVAPLLVVGGALAVVTTRLEANFLDSVLEQHVPGLLDRLLIAAAAVMWYPLQVLLPWRLTPMHPPWSTTAGAWYWWLPLLAVAAATLYWIRHCAKFKDGNASAHTHWAIVHYLALLLPTLGLIPFGNLAVTFVSEHFLYVAAIGLFVCMGLAFDTLAARGGATRSVTIIVGIAAALGYAGAAWKYMPVYQDAESMWTRALQTHPTCFPASIGLARVRAQQGRLNEAAELYRRAESIIPAYARTYIEHGRLQMQIATAQLRIGDTPGAVVRFGTAADIFADAVERDPTLADGWQGVAECRRLTGDHRAALTALREGIRHDPDNVSLMNLLARLCATSPDDSVRNAGEALRWAEATCRATGFQNHQALETLAAAQAEAGRFGEAAATARRAAEFARAGGDDRAAAEYIRRAEQYASGRPLREPGLR